jgi:hypothetical protein
VLITRGQVGAENADAAARSLAAYDVAARAETAAAQAAEDPTAPPQPAPPKTEPGHVDELASQAETAGHDAIKARATAATARARVETTAPGALEAREDARRAEFLAADPNGPPQLEGGQPPQPWDDWPHGYLSDAELVDTAARGRCRTDRGLSSNRTVNGVSGSGRAELSPSTVPMRVASLRSRSCNGSVALGWLLMGRSYFAAYAGGVPD